MVTFEPVITLGPIIVWATIVLIVAVVLVRLSREVRRGDRVDAKLEVLQGQIKDIKRVLMGEDKDNEPRSD